jgi:hypothetical protein
MVSPHCISQINKGEINVDTEMIEYLTEKSQGTDSAFVLGEMEFLGDNNYVILIVRHEVAITIEFRRITQSLNTNCLGVEQIIKFPCLM